MGIIKNKLIEITFANVRSWSRRSTPQAESCGERSQSIVKSKQLDCS